MNIENHMKKLLESKVKLDKTLKLQGVYPDLDVETDRWGTTRYKSKSVNSKCTEVDFRRTCGCCDDPGILAMPYIETEAGYVYSDPFRMEIGEGRTYSYVQEWKGWEEKYRKIGIPEETIAKIRCYLDAEIKTYKEDDDDD